MQRKAVTKDKILRYKVQFSKVTQCDVVKPIKRVPENKYIEDLIQLTVDAVRNGVKLKLPTVLSLQNQLENDPKKN